MGVQPEKAIHNASLFKVGETLGEDGVKIKVTSLEPLQAKVLEVNSHWLKHGFTIDQELTFTPCLQSNSWKIDDSGLPPNERLPIFILNGARKYFEFYK